MEKYSHILQVPGHHIFCGKSMSGKTTAVIDLIKQSKKYGNPWTLPNGKILWIKNEDAGEEEKVENLQDELSDKKLGDSMAILATNNIDQDHAEIDEWINENHASDLNSLIVLDNLGFSTDKSPYLTSLMQHGRLRGVSVFNIIHELFSCKQLKAQRGLADYFHCFYLLGSDVNNLIKQMYGSDKNEYGAGLDVYKECMNKPYGFLTVDVSARPSDTQRWANRERMCTFFPKQKIGRSKRNFKKSE